MGQWGRGTEGHKGKDAQVHRGRGAEGHINCFLTPCSSCSGISCVVR